MVSLPIHQKKNELDNATAHAKWLMHTHKHVCFENIELTSVFEKNSLCCLRVFVGLAITYT